MGHRRARDSGQFLVWILISEVPPSLYIILGPSAGAESLRRQISFGRARRIAKQVMYYCGNTMGSNRTISCCLLILALASYAFAQGSGIGSGPGTGPPPPQDNMPPSFNVTQSTFDVFPPNYTTIPFFAASGYDPEGGAVKYYITSVTFFTAVGGRGLAAQNLTHWSLNTGLKNDCIASVKYPVPRSSFCIDHTTGSIFATEREMDASTRLLIDGSFAQLVVQMNDPLNLFVSTTYTVNIKDRCGSSTALLSALENKCQGNSRKTFSGEQYAENLPVGTLQNIPVAQVNFMRLNLKDVQGTYTVKMNTTLGEVSQVYTVGSQTNVNITFSQPAQTDATNRFVKMRVEDINGNPALVDPGAFILYSVPSTSSCLDNTCIASLEAWRDSVNKLKTWTSHCMERDSGLLRYEYGDCANNKLPLVKTSTFNVLENAAAGTVIGSVSATDADGGTLTYDIYSVASPQYDMATTPIGRTGIKFDDCINSTAYGTPRNFFCIEFVSGKIKTTTLFAPRAKLGDVFTVQMYVYDSGPPLRRAIGNIMINTIDNCHPTSEIYRNFTIAMSKTCPLTLRAARLDSKVAGEALDFTALFISKLIEINIKVAQISRILPAGTTKLLVNIRGIKDPTNFAEFSVNYDPQQTILKKPFQLYVSSLNGRDTVRATIRPINASGTYPPIVLSVTAITLSGNFFSTFCRRGNCVSAYKQWHDSLKLVPSECASDPFNLMGRYEDCFAKPVILASPKEFSQMLFSTKLSQGPPPPSISSYIECSYFTYDGIPTIEWLKDGKVLPKEACSAGGEEEPRKRRETTFVVPRQMRAACYLLKQSPDEQGLYSCRITSKYGGSVTSKQGLVQFIDLATSKLSLQMTTIRFDENMNNRSSAEFRSVEKTVKSWFSSLVSQSTLNNLTYQIVITNVRRGSVIADMNVYFTNLTQDERLTVSQTVDTLPDISAPSTEFLIQDRQITTFDGCSAVTSGRADLKGIMEWNATLVGSFATLNCNHGSGKSTRYCRPNLNIGPQWDAPDDSQCGYRNPTTNYLQQLSEANITSENVTEAAQSLVNLTSTTSPLTTEFDYQFATVTIEHIVAINSSSPEIATLVLEVINNLLSFNKVLIARAQKDFGSSTSILHTLEFLAGQVDVSSGSSRGGIELPNLALRVLDVPFSSVYQIQGLTLSSPTSNSTNSNLTVLLTPGNSTALSVSAQASIYLPPSIFAMAFSNQTSITVRVTTFVFINDYLFIPEGELEIIGGTTNQTSNRTVDSRVMSASLPGYSIQNLTNPLQSYFSSVTQNGTRTDAHCVFWDFGITGSRGSWSSDGCNLRAGMNGEYICECNHLTNFAVLLDVNDPGTATSSLVLEIITYIGCGISMAGLLLTLLTFAIFPNLRKALPPKILICLCISLLALLIIFVVGIDRTSPRTGCQVVGLLLHYFVLATFCWMAVEGYNLYRCFVKVIGLSSHKFMLKASIFAWGVPAVIVGVTAGIKWDEYGNDKNCMLQGNTFYFAFLTPVLAILVINFVVIFLVLVGIRRGSQLSKDRKTDGKTQLRIVFACSILLGLTWASAIFAVGDLRLTFQIVFCVLNSLQGFFIFLFYCARNQDVRKEWKRVLGVKSEDSRASTTGSTGKKGKTASTLNSKSGKSTRNGQDHSLLSNGQQQRRNPDVQLTETNGRYQPRTNGDRYSSDQSL